MKFRILLLNCTERSEPSEVRFLSELLEMMKLRYPKRIDFSSVEVRSKKDLENQLKLT